MAKKKMEDVGALWAKESKSGNEYFSGKLKDGTRVVAFKNTNKKNDNEPDIRIYLSEDRPEYKKPDNTPF